ncbi:hypothetical protein FZC74_17645 [Sutcliffiella horikoshii]|uniref:Uncharacterized protein n=1 Tax=Sutcliffiella horikoshii TaxID=79883 RepID=A0AA94WNJ8_9BACI|nr:hypothetical protein [Sutcliffiella horikoshii]TYS55883.1 hypothetical protein FZC74_17645 [Sutcliffiella horikoshii]
MVDSVLTLKFLISLIVFGVFLVGAVKLLLRKSRLGPISVVLVVLLGGYYLYDQMISTTSDAAVLNDVHEDSEIRSLEIRKLEFEGSTYSFKERIMIEEEETIQEILKDLSGLDLKRDINKERGGADYVLNILVSNQKENVMETGNVQIIVGKEYIDDYYKIVSEKDHLKTIKELEREVEWKEE